MNASHVFSPAPASARPVELAGSPDVSAAPTAAYPQPQPSSQEQYLLELINAARANPAAEGQMLANVTDPEILRYYQYYKVSTSQLVSQFNGYAAKPPLAFNADLMASSRQQSLYQASSGVQTHDSANGTTFDKRITAAGYQWSGGGRKRLRLRGKPLLRPRRPDGGLGRALARPPREPPQHGPELPGVPRDRHFRRAVEHLELRPARHHRRLRHARRFRRRPTWSASCTRTPTATAPTTRARASPA